MMAFESFRSAYRFVCHLFGLAKIQAAQQFVTNYNNNYECSRFTMETM